MKRGILILLYIFVCGTGFAASTCIHNRTAMFVIKKSVNGISSSFDADEKTWSVKFDYDLVPNNSAYRTLTGNATCNEVATDTTGVAIVAGESNVYLRASNADVGTRCWCAMDAPVSSWWVFLKEYDSDSSCAAGCVRDCASAIKLNTNNFRSNGVYRAIW